MVLRGLSDPVQDTDVATKRYVDASRGGGDNYIATGGNNNYPAIAFKVGETNEAVFILAVCLQGYIGIVFSDFGISGEKTFYVQQCELVYGHITNSSGTGYKYNTSSSQTPLVVVIKVNK